MCQLWPERGQGTLLCARLPIKPLHVYDVPPLLTTKCTGVPADARHLLGVSYPSSQRQHVLTVKTLSCNLGLCADRASAIDTLATTDIPLPT